MNVKNQSCRVLAAAPHVEHMGFVGLAGAEVFHLKAYLFAINSGLLVFGILVIVREIFDFGVIDLLAQYARRPAPARVAA